MNRCAEYEHLVSQVDEILQQLVDKAILQLEVFRSRKPGEFMRIDKELELLLGEKERRVGALQQHAREHACHADAA